MLETGDASPVPLTFWGGAQMKSLLGEVLEVAVLALGLYLVITVAVQTVHVIGLSMYPTLDNDDYLIATKIDYHFHHPQRGDIIIMRDPYDPSKDFVKRVIALPNERLLIRDSHIYVNGKLLSEPYLVGPEPWTVNNNWPVNGTGDGEAIPSNAYFVMGDNRNHSSDSRMFGFVRGDQIEAHCMLRIWPVGHFVIYSAPPRLATTQTLGLAAA
jgi:signal peptidase I